MIKHTFFAVSIGLIIFFLYLMQYTGAFKSVPVAVDERGPFTMIAMAHSGAYHKTVEKTQFVEAWAKKNNLKCRLSFGEYLDNPRIAEEGRLRSYGGCLIDPLIPEEMEILKKLRSALPKDVEIREFPKTKSVVALFTGAPGIGPMKVYPKAEEFMQKGSLVPKGPVLEVYEILSEDKMHTTYIWPLAN